MGEDKATFIQRYMNSPEAKDSHSDPSQRRVVAESQWNKYQNIKKNSPYREENLMLCPSFQLAFGTAADNITKGLDNPEESNASQSSTNTGTQVQIVKARADEHLVFGWANIAKDKNGKYPLDWDQDQTQPEELEKAVYKYVQGNDGTGENHQGDTKGSLVESVMFTKEKMGAMGIPDGLIPEGWWVGFHVPDEEVFAKIKKGDYGMFSVQGKGFRIPINTDT